MSISKRRLKDGTADMAMVERLGVVVRATMLDWYEL